MRTSLDPKYSHLCDELHVEIQAHAPPAEAYARIAYALAEIKKYLIPDTPEDARPDFQQFPSGPAAPVSGSLPPPPVRGAPGGRGRGGRGAGRPLMGAGRGMHPGLGGMHRPQGKAKVMSILDKARSAMEESFGGPEYDDGGYYDGPAPMP